jgi:hypothetical protein
LLEDRDMAVRARAAALLGRLLRPVESEQPAAPEPAAKPAQPAEPAKAHEPTPPADSAKDQSPAAAPTDEEAPVKQLVDGGVRLLASKEFGRAESMFEKARRQCEKERKSSPACAELSFELSYQLGRAHEGQRHLAQAMVEYENAVKHIPKKGAKPALVAAAQDAVVQLVPKLGIVVLPKVGGKGCREVSIWMEPGRHEIQVNGHREVVEVRAQQTSKVGSCPSSAP